MFSVRIFRYNNILFDFSVWIYYISIIFLFEEEFLNWKILISFLLSVLISTNIVPYIGFPLYSFLFICPIRYRVPFSEINWEKNPIKLYKIRSYFILLIQSIVCITVYFIRTQFFLKN